MICRIWHGYTTYANADAYEHVVRSIVIPGIEARTIPGFIAIDLLKRSLDTQVQFTTLMWFETEQAIISFVGQDATIAHVPPQAQQVLARFDQRSQHYTVLDRRPQQN